MIIKVERHDKEQQWWLMDNIAKVSCSNKLRGGEEDISQDDILILDHKDDSNPLYYRLICRTKDFSEFSIVFDTIAYLCNDDGKTIEKIVAI